ASAKYASSAVAALRASDSIRARNPRSRYTPNCGMAMAARIPTTPTTTRSSISVKPFERDVLRADSFMRLSFSSWAVTRASSEHRAQPEDRQIHRYHQSPDHHAEEQNQGGLEQGEQAGRGRVHLVVVAVGHAGQHDVEGAGRFADGDHLPHQRRNLRAFGEGLRHRLPADETGGRAGARA